MGGYRQAIRQHYFSALLVSIALLLAASPAVADNRPQLSILTSFPPDFYRPFEQAFVAQYPSLKVSIRNKKTTSAIKYLERQPDSGYDLFWASAPDAFDILNSAGLLETVSDVPFPYPLLINGYPSKQADDRYLGFALSGYGAMFNRSYLKRWNLRPPQSWADLADPGYFSHLGLSSPSRSGTTHLMIEMILQHHGWRQGWSYILRMAANAVTITARSYGVPEGIQQGRFGLGLVIDFLARKIDFPDIDFVYAEESRYLPASIALLKQSTNSVAAKAFMRFLLSRSGQQLLLAPQIARLPIDPLLYSDDRTPINPYALDAANPVRPFDTGLSRQRYALVNALFDHLITFQHETLKRVRAKLIEARQGLDRVQQASTPQRRQLDDIEAALFNFPVNPTIRENVGLLTRLEAAGSSSSLSGYLPPPLSSIKLGWEQNLVELESRVERILESIE